MWSALAVAGARGAELLPLPARGLDTTLVALEHDRVPAVREFLDEGADVGGLRGRPDLVHVPRAVAGIDGHVRRRGHLPVREVLCEEAHLGEDLGAGGGPELDPLTGRAGPPHVPVVGQQQSGEDAGQGGLARAVRAHQGGHLAAAHRQAHAAQRGGGQGAFIVHEGLVPPEPAAVQLLLGVGDPTRRRGAPRPDPHRRRLRSGDGPRPAPSPAARDPGCRAVRICRAVRGQRTSCSNAVATHTECKGVLPLGACGARVFQEAPPRRRVRGCRAPEAGFGRMVSVRRASGQGSATAGAARSGCGSR